MMVAEACQQKEAVDGLAEGRRRGDSLSICAVNTCTLQELGCNRPVLDTGGR